MNIRPQECNNCTDTCLGVYKSTTELYNYYNDVIIVSIWHVFEQCVVCGSYLYVTMVTYTVQCGMVGALSDSCDYLRKNSLLKNLLVITVCLNLNQRSSKILSIHFCIMCTPVDTQFIVDSHSLNCSSNHP